MTKGKHGGAVGKELSLSPTHRARGGRHLGLPSGCAQEKVKRNVDTDCGPEFDKISLRDRSASPPPTFNTDPTNEKAYCSQKLVLTMGSTLTPWRPGLVGHRAPIVYPLFAITESRLLGFPTPPKYHLG